MKRHINSIILKSIILGIIFIQSCTSIKKYNEAISQKHQVKELHKDLEKVYSLLVKYHPDIDWYISKEELKKSFDSLKFSIKEPMSSNDFYLKLAPIVSKIKQGHTSITPPLPRRLKKDIKKKGEIYLPLTTLGTKSVNNRLFIDAIYKRDTTVLKGTEILSVEGKSVQKLMNEFKKTQTGDGFNQTFLPRLVGKRFARFYAYKKGIKDSIQVELKDSLKIYNYTFHKYYPKKDTIGKKKRTLYFDTITYDAFKKMSKKERKKIKKNKGEKTDKEQIWKLDHGYNQFTGLSNRNFKFIKSGDSINTAYLKIRSFTKGAYSNFYEQSFKSIDSAKTKHLIIDLRDNFGGRLVEIEDLYSYLVQENYQFIKYAKMTKETSYLAPVLTSKSFISKFLGVLFSPIIATVQIIKVKNIDGIPHFKFRQSKMNKPKKEFNYSGKIYVLINGNSFSASSILSTKLKAHKRAIFIGEETGGAYNGTVAGLFGLKELKYSKLKLRIGVMTIEAPEKTTPDGYGIKPDIYSVPTVESVQKGKDIVLDKALDLIKD